MATVLDDDVVIRGRLTANNVDVPASSVGDTQMNASDPLDVDKMLHQHSKSVFENTGASGTTFRRVIHVARAAGTLVEWVASVQVAAVGAATYAVDLYKNGSTILSSVPTINNTHAAYAKVLGSFSSVDYVAGDVFEIKTTATAGGGTLPQGCGGQLTVDEGDA